MAKGKGKGKSKTKTGGSTPRTDQSAERKDKNRKTEHDVSLETHDDSVDKKMQSEHKEVRSDTDSVPLKDFKGNKEHYHRKESPGGSKGEYDTHRSEFHYRANSRRSEPIKISERNRDNANRDNQQRRSSNGNARDNRRPRDRSIDSNESDFRTYEDQFRQNRGHIAYERTNEIEQDLFQMSNEYSLAHCVAEDMGMGSGIAVTFRYKFKRVDELLNQRQTTGGLAVLKDEDRYIYYLVTKKHSTGKPTYRTLFSSLKVMRKHMEEHNVKKLAMPRIGCGLDRLEWDNVKFMVEYIFKDTEVDIVICNLQQVEDSPQPKHRNCKQVNVTYPIENIEEGTIIVYLSSEDGYISQEMKALDEKFHFLTDFRYHRKRLRDTIIFSKNENYLLAGCIVKKHDADSIDFEALRSCMVNIMQTNKKYQFEYVGFQAIKDEQDSCINYKIINILRNSLRNVDVYVCWPGDLALEMSSKDKYNESFTSDIGDTYESRDSTQQRSGRYSFSRKEKWSEGNNNWKNEPKREEPFKKNLFEVKSGKSSYRPDSSNYYQSNTANEAREATEQDTIDWFNESNPTSSKEFEQALQDKVETSFETSLKRKPSVEPILTSFSENQSMTTDNEYEKYMQEHKSSCYKITKISNKALSLQEKYSQVCYVSEDMCLQSAAPDRTHISTYLGYLLNQQQKEGSCVFVEDGREKLYFLIVKKRSTAPPVHDRVFASIQQLRNLVVQHGIRKLVIPVMEKSKDEAFEWSEVSQMLDFLFRGTRADVHLAPFPSENYMELLKKRKVRLNHVKTALFQAKKKSMIIYWASEDGTFSTDMDSLKKEFDFANEFQSAEKRTGKVIRYKKDDRVLYGCIVKKTQNDKIDYVALEKCISIVSDTNVERFSLVAATAVEDDDETVNDKIINILVNNLKDVTINFCWPLKLRDKMPLKSS